MQMWCFFLPITITAKFDLYWIASQHNRNCFPLRLMKWDSLGCKISVQVICAFFISSLCFCYEFEELFIVLCYYFPRKERQIWRNASNNLRTRKSQEFLNANSPKWQNINQQTKSVTFLCTQRNESGSQIPSQQLQLTN